MFSNASPKVFSVEAQDFCAPFQQHQNASEES